MEGLKISEVIKILEDLKGNYGDVRVATPVPYEWFEYDFIKKIEIENIDNEIVALIW